MLLKFRDLSYLDKPVGSKLVGLKRGGFRPVSIELDYNDLTKLLAAPDLTMYLLHLQRALAPHPQQTPIGVSNAK